MRQRLFFLVILLLPCFFFFYFGVKSFYELKTYFQQSERETFELGETSIKKEKSSYSVIGKFLIRERAVQIPLKGPYPNQIIAEKEKESLNVSYEVWVNEGHPEKSVIFKKFPYKSIMYTLILFGLIIYFLFLLKFFQKRAS